MDMAFLIGTDFNLFPQMSIHLSMIYQLVFVYLLNDMLIITFIIMLLVN